jgi:hypothetical protein
MAESRMTAMYGFVGKILLILVFQLLLAFSKQSSETKKVLPIYSYSECCFHQQR